jgi:sodium-dependent dicarboxylate transporter 2/3/5
VSAQVEEGGGFGPAGRKLGLVLGPLLAGGLLLAGPPDGLGTPAWITVALMSLMIVWWVTEALPISATALLPLAVLPLAGVTTPAEAAAPYADPILFLFIAGFMIAVTIERWNLHARIALQIAARVGARPSALIGGFILAAALLSLWISNTATALMLTPIAMGVARELDAHGTATPPWARAWCWPWPTPPRSAAWALRSARPPI